MSLTDAARRHHDELLGATPSVLAGSDPEIVEVFDNWLYDEVLSDAAALDDTLDRRTRLLVQLAAVLAAGGLAQWRFLAAAAVARGGVSPVELKESVYQAVAYVGMARASDYLHAANDVLADAGVAVPLPGQSTTTRETRQGVGREVQGRIVGADRVEAMHAEASADTAHFQRYLTGNCFGDIVARDGLDVPTRELLTFAMLTGLGGADAQLRAHVSGNLRVGSSRQRLLAVLTVITPYVGYPRALNALAAVDDVAAAD